MLNKFFKKRFDELEERSMQIEASKAQILGSAEYSIDNDLLLNWRVKVKNLLSKVCGEESQHFHQFEKTEDTVYYYSETV